MFVFLGLFLLILRQVFDRESTCAKHVALGLQTWFSVCIGASQFGTVSFISEMDGRLSMLIVGFHSSTKVAGGS